MVEFNVPVTAEVALCPSGVVVVEFKVPVTADVPLCPRGVNVPVAVEPVRLAADTPEPLEVNSLWPLPEVKSARVPAPKAGTVVVSPVNVCAAAVKELMVSAGIVVVSPVKVWAAADSKLTVSAGTVVVSPVKPCAAAVSEFTVGAAAVSEFTVSAGTVVVSPVKPCAAAVRLFTVGVIVSLPPVPPTSPFAATVPNRVTPFNAATSLQPAGQVPETTNVIKPEGIAGAGVVQPQVPSDDSVRICPVEQVASAGRTRVIGPCAFSEFAHSKQANTRNSDLVFITAFQPSHVVSRPCPLRRRRLMSSRNHTGCSLTPWRSPYKSR